MPRWQVAVSRPRRATRLRSRCPALSRQSWLPTHAPAPPCPGGQAAPCGPRFAGRPPSPPPPGSPRPLLCPPAHHVLRLQVQVLLPTRDSPDPRGRTNPPEAFLGGPPPVRRTDQHGPQGRDRLRPERRGRTPGRPPRPGSPRAQTPLSSRPSSGPGPGLLAAQRSKANVYLRRPRLQSGLRASLTSRRGRAPDPPGYALPGPGPSVAVREGRLRGGGSVDPAPAAGLAIGGHR